MIAIFGGRKLEDWLIVDIFGGTFILNKERALNSFLALMLATIILEVKQLV